jgi:hypothetical protein
MSIVHRVRGVVFKGVQAAALAVAFLLAAQEPACANATALAAELKSFEREDGQNFFALSLSAPEAAAAKDDGRDVVILFDTSASQTGMYRDTALAALEACVAKLGSADRVQIMAVDLEARRLTNEFVPVGSEELRQTLAALRNEPPLGSTDMELVLRSAADCFREARATGRTVLYIGDGLSAANLLGTDTFRQLVETFSTARIAITSYAIGPQCDGRLLAALANQTGGNLYIAEPIAMADEAAQVSQQRAQEENVRRGAGAGAMLAEWTRASVYWPRKSHGRRSWVKCIRSRCRRCGAIATRLSWVWPVRRCSSRSTCGLAPAMLSCGGRSRQQAPMLETRSWRRLSRWPVVTAESR